VRNCSARTRWISATGRSVAEAGTRPVLDADFELERGSDYTGTDDRESNR